MLVGLMMLTTAASVPVEVGRFDQTQFPNAKKIERRIPQAELVRRVDKIMAAKQCTIPGQVEGQVQLVVPYAVLMEPDGQASKIVVKDTGCEPIEILVGQVANELIRAGDFRKTRTTSSAGMSAKSISRMVASNLPERSRTTIKSSARRRVRESAQGWP